MSQRECAGFNWPPLSIPAVEPVSISPSAVIRAGPVTSEAAVCKFAPPWRPSLPTPVLSVAFGVGHPANGTVSDKPIMPGLGLTFPCLIASVAVHVGQPANSIRSKIDGAEEGALADVRRADAR